MLGEVGFLSFIIKILITLDLCRYYYTSPYYTLISLLSFFWFNLKLLSMTDLLRDTALRVTYNQSVRSSYLDYQPQVFSCKFSYVPKSVGLQATLLLLKHKMLKQKQNVCLSGATTREIEVISTTVDRN